MKRLRVFFILLISILSFSFLNISEEEKIVASSNIKEVIQENEEQERKHYDFSNNIIAYIMIPDTEFDIAVTQTTNNNYYLDHDIYGKKRDKGNPFLDYRDSINKAHVLRIYGHNSSTIYTEFNFLENYYDKDFFDKHKYIILETEKKIKKYEIFSLYTEVRDWSYYNAEFDDKDVMKEELAKYKSKSDYDTGVNVEDDENILILQTCSYKREYRKYDHKFYLVFAKEVKNVKNLT